MPVSERASQRKHLEGYVVGAYAASPAHRTWHPELEESFLCELERDGRVCALELPWMGRLHPHDEHWLLQHLPRRLDVVLTDIPHIMTVLQVDGAFGLASGDVDGRQRAINQVARLRDDVCRLNDSSGGATVAVVELHSAPRGCGTTRDLADSLTLISAWDWDGADLVIEHCDAWIAGQTAEKGFLSLEDEIRAITLADAGIGISINWGRSAIEFRDPARVTEHLEAASATGHLAGFMVSGASDTTSTFGGEWIDAHHPFQLSDDHPYGLRESLLTPHHLEAALSSAGQLAWMGAKVGWPAEVPGTVAQRVAMISAALDECDRARVAVSQVPQVHPLDAIPHP